ncbi:MAG: hypothetical protein AB2531_12880 [Candidatus Thiodiazotropha sp.]
MEKASKLAAWVWPPKNRQYEHLKEEMGAGDEEGRCELPKKELDAKNEKYRCKQLKMEVDTLRGEEISIFMLILGVTTTISGVAFIYFPAIEAKTGMFSKEDGLLMAGALTLGYTIFFTGTVVLILSPMIILGGRAFSDQKGYTEALPFLGFAGSISGLLLLSGHSTLQTREKDL